jgi:hypothetical protein
MITPIVMEYTWIIGVELQVQNKRHVLLSVYMPYESQENEEQFLANLGALQGIIDDIKCTSVHIIGDWNADPHKPSKFGSHLIQYCEESDLVLSSAVKLPSDSFTYISEVWHTTSMLDHCISSLDGDSIITNMYVDYSLAIGDHLPLFIEIDIVLIPKMDTISNDVSPKLNWKRLLKDDIAIIPFALTNI